MRIAVSFRLLSLSLVGASLGACSEEQQGGRYLAAQPLISGKERAVIDAALNHARVYGRTKWLLSRPDICLDRQIEPRLMTGPIGMRLNVVPPPGYEAVGDGTNHDTKVIPGVNIGGVQLCDTALASGQIRTPSIFGDRAHVQLEWHAERSNYWMKREQGRWTVSEVTWMLDDI